MVARFCKGWMSVLVVLSLVGVLAACDTNPLPVKEVKMDFQTSGLSLLRAGEAGRLQVNIQRENYTGEITVELISPPEGIRAEAQHTTGNSAVLVIQVAATVEVGTHVLNVAASGNGVVRVEKQVTMQVAPSDDGSGTDPKPQPVIDAHVVEGTIQNWDAGVQLIQAYSLQGELLDQDEVGVDGKLRLELREPKALFDLDTDFSQGLCATGTSTLASNPANLPGTVVAGYDNSGFDLVIYEQSYPRKTLPLDGDVWVIRVYSAISGSVTGHCQSWYGGERWEFDLNLQSGWNIVAITYKASVGSFHLSVMNKVPDKARLVFEYEGYVNGQEPVANLEVLATGFNEVWVDGSGSYDPDGYITEYYFDMGDGTYYYFASFDYPVFYHQYQNSGYFVVSLCVYDNEYWGSCTYQEVYVY